MENVYRVRQSEQTFRSRDESQPLAVFSCSQEYSTPTHWKVVYRPFNALAQRELC